MMVKYLTKMFILTVFTFADITNVENHGLCVTEVIKFSGDIALLSCAPTQADDVYQHLKGPLKWNWTAQSTTGRKSHDQFEFKIDPVDVTTSGAFQCSITGYTADGYEESYVFYHYVMPVEIPRFFTAHRTTAKVKLCDKRKLKYAERKLSGYATHPRRCVSNSGNKSVVFCYKKALISCKRNQVTIDFVDLLSKDAIAGPANYTEKGEFSMKLLKNSVKQIRHYIDMFAELPKVKHYFRKVRHFAGFGYTCEDGFFSEKGNMDFSKALAHGPERLPEVFCIPCPAGTYGYNGTCKLCQPGFFNQFLGKTKCSACPNGSIKYVGAKSLSECLSQNNENSFPEYLEPCTVSKMTLMTG